MCRGTHSGLAAGEKVRGRAGAEALGRAGWSPGGSGGPGEHGRTPRSSSLTTGPILPLCQAPVNHNLPQEPSGTRPDEGGSPSPETRALIPGTPPAVLSSARGEGLQLNPAVGTDRGSSAASGWQRGPQAEAQPSWGGLGSQLRQDRAALAPQGTRRPVSRGCLEPHPTQKGWRPVWQP